MVTTAAAANGHLECLKYLHENGCPWIGGLYVAATALGHLDCIQFAFEQGLRWPDYYVGCVAMSGNLDILKFVVNNGGRLDRNITYAAAERNHIDCLQFLLEVNCPVDVNTGAIVAERGHLQCLTLLHQHLSNDWWDARITASAAIGGQLECLQYLHENGCPWDDRTTNCAAGKAHLDCLRYAFEHNCPFDPDLIKRSVRTVSPESVACLEYLMLDRWLPLYDDAPEFQEAFTMGNYYAVQYLIDQDRPFLKCKFSDEQLDSAFIVSTFLEKNTHEYDGNLVKCIACIVSNRWSLARNGAGLRKFLKVNADKLPLSAAFVANNRYTMVESMLLPFR